jgi:hypothetical protein
VTGTYACVRARARAGESVNMSQMYIKRKTCIIRTWKRTFISRHARQHWYTCPIALQVRRNPQHRSLLSQSLPHLVGHHLRLPNISQRISRPRCKPLYATNTSHCKQETFLMNNLCIESFCPQKRTTEC